MTRMRRVHTDCSIAKALRATLCRHGSNKLCVSYRLCALAAIFSVHLCVAVPLWFNPFRLRSSKRRASPCRRAVVVQNVFNPNAPPAS